MSCLNKPMEQAPPFSQALFVQISPNLSLQPPLTESLQSSSSLSHSQSYLLSHLLSSHSSFSLSSFQILLQSSPLSSRVKSYLRYKWESVQVSGVIERDKNVNNKISIEKSVIHKNKPNTSKKSLFMCLLELIFLWHMSIPGFRFRLSVDIDKPRYLNCAHWENENKF